MSHGATGNAKETAQPTTQRTAPVSFAPFQVVFKKTWAFLDVLSDLYQANATHKIQETHRCSCIWFLGSDIGLEYCNFHPHVRFGMGRQKNRAKFKVLPGKSLIHFHFQKDSSELLTNIFLQHLKLWCLLYVSSLIYLLFIHSSIDQKCLQIPPNESPLWAEDDYLSGDFAVVVKVIEGEGPLLPVILLHRYGTLQLLKQRSIEISVSSSTCVYACVCVYLCVSCHWPSFIHRVSNKCPVRCWHSLQTGAVSVALREIGCPSPASSPPHSSCLSSLGVKPLQWHTDTHTQR